MKQKLTLSLFFVVTLFSSKAQSVDQYVQDNYSAEIVTKIYNLVSKTNISGDKQRAIAGIFKNQDNAIAVMIKNNETKRAIDSVNSLYQNSWKAILSATDQFYYSTETAKENKDLRYSYTLLSLAIKYKDDLSLSAPLTDYLLSKIDSLKIKEDLFYQQNPTQVFNSYTLQNQYINSVLSDLQYSKLMDIKGKERAYSKAKIDWEELTQKGLAINLNADSTISQFVKFYLKKDFIYGRYQQNLSVRRVHLQNLYDTEPDAMRKLYYSRKYKNTQDNNKPGNFSQFLFAIKNTDKLGLSEDKEKELLNKANELEKLKEEAYSLDSTKPYDSRKYECENLKQILSPEQYENLLNIKNSGRAKNAAYTDWRELTQRNMIAGHDKDSTIAELSDYYLRRLNAIDKNEDDKIRQSDVLKELYDTKPNALSALIKARRSPGNDTQGQSFQW
ncbi:MAG TPA: hypothetical protein DCQ50_21110 [Chryseobacterium sp.]|nr:hypothetical protein [Chryseobacterium sp.]